MTTSAIRNSLRCPKCSRHDFNTRAGLSSHLRIVHKITGPVANLIGPRPKTGISLFAPTIKCPQCPAMFKRKTGLGSHLRLIHGVHGQASTTRAYHRKKERDAAAASPVQKMLPTLEEHPTAEEQIVPAQSIDLTSNPKFKCPECKQANFISPAHLGRHRRWTHGVIGKFTKEKEAKEAKEVTAAVAEPTPKRRGRPPGPRPATSENHSTQLQTTERSIPHVQRFDNAESQFVIDPLSFALAIGSIQEFCRHTAEEHGVPTRQFTRQCAELFFRQTRR